MLEIGYCYTKNGSVNHEKENKNAGNFISK
jgi:hypothetical protein